MCRSAAAFFLVLGLWMLGVHAVRADTHVQVVETYPSGDEITLDDNQNFYLRLHYSTDSPVQIWAEPYFDGKPAHAGSNPSRTYEGSGDALGWFFLMNADAQVDEVRIRAGDGSPDGTREVARYPVHVSGGAGNAHGSEKPEWVTRLSALDAAAQRADYERRMNEPLNSSDIALYNGFMLAMLALFLFGVAGPAWGVWRWRGGWRLAAALPATLMAFVVLRIVIGTTADPTSHNLWPFEILIAGAISTGAMVVLMIGHRFLGTSDQG